MIGDVLVSPFFIDSTYVCDLKIVMRTRLMFGLYNNMYIPTRLKLYAKAYCIVFSTVVAFCSGFLSIQIMNYPLMCLYYLARLTKFIAISVISLISDDSYNSKLLNRVNVTDATLDSSPIFVRLRKYVYFMFCGIFFLKAIEISVFSHDWTQAITCSPITIVEIAADLNANNQFLVLFLLYCRVVILRRKLERYGLRSIRNSRFRIKVYSEMYFKIMQAYQTLYHFKLLMVVDLLGDSGYTIIICSSMVRFYTENSEGSLTLILVMILASLRMLVYLSLNCFTLNAVADQVDAMQTFVVTELIKNPTAADRRAMYDFLLLTDAMPPRFSLFRTVEVNVALLLTVVAFCSSRIVLFVQTFY